VYIFQSLQDFFYKGSRALYARSFRS